MLFFFAVYRQVYEYSELPQKMWTNLVQEPTTTHNSDASNVPYNIQNQWVNMRRKWVLNAFWSQSLKSWFYFKGHMSF